MEEPATCAFARRAENILFLGPPGVGKSHLAMALGVKAIKNGFRVHHYVLDELDPHAASGGDDPVSPPAAALPDRVPF